MRRFCPICLAAAVTVIVGSLALAKPVQHYTFTDLGAIPNVNYSEAVAINNSGQVIVNAYGTSFVWTPNKPNGTAGTFWNMGTIIPEGQDMDPVYETFAYGINDKGEIVGVSGYSNYFRWSRAALPFRTRVGRKLDRTCLMRRGELHFEEPRAINNWGVVVGALVGVDSSHAVKWGPDGSYVSLGKLNKHDLAAGANDINDCGTIVGYSEEHAWVLTGMHKRDLGKGRANAVNNHDVIVGVSNKRACVWVQGKLRPLDTNLYSLGNYYNHDLEVYSTAQDINDKGQIVGIYEASAVLWYRGKVTDLNEVAPIPANWNLVSAKAINNKGQIVGTATVGDKTVKRAFLLTPIERSQ